MGLNQYVDEPTSETVQRLLPGAALEPVLKPLSFSKDPVRQPGITYTPQADYRFALLFQPEKQRLASDSVHSVREALLFLVSALGGRCIWKLGREAE